MSTPPGVTGPQGKPGQVPAGGTPIGVGGSGAYIPAPKRVSPPASSATGGFNAGASADGWLPADLFASWRSLMQALGTTVPYHLNRTVRVARALRRKG